MLVSVHHKINLGLQVIEKLPSGYHAIETVFYPCNSYEDTIEIIASDHFSFTIKNADFFCEDEQNMCVKAYYLLKKHYDLPPVNITLTKNIPSGSGLGGGSADAAFTLKILNALFSLQLTTQQLHEYALQLGSDTVFFLYNTPMHASGRGEILNPVHVDLSKYNIEIVCLSEVNISTAYAYSIIIPKKSQVSLQEIINLPIENWKDTLINDFEAVIFKRYSQLQEIKNDLYRRGALYASMSGSGSAIYGIFNI